MISILDWAPYLAATRSREAFVQLASRAGHGQRRPRPATTAGTADRLGAGLGPSEADEVVGFWRAAGPAQWFAKDDDFDRLLRERFLHLYEAASRGDLREWLGWPTGALALLILLDQFPRNAFRGTPRMYVTDAMARDVAIAAIDAGHDRAVEPELQVFFYLPFGHAESLEDQKRCVALAERLGEPHLSHARQHRDIIRRFGRFPHRNPILARPMREDEQRFLDEGGFSG
jgi:uncharacterized protein (DUF924 family)